MTHRFRTTLGLALFAVALSGAVHAQSAEGMDPATLDETPLERPEMSQSTGASGSGEAGTLPASPRTAAELRADVPQTYGQVISSLHNADLAMADPETVVDASSAEIRPLSALKGQAKESAVALDDALEAAGAELDALRSLLAGNEALTAALDGEGYAAQDVIGVYASGGAIELLVDDRA